MLMSLRVRKCSHTDRSQEMEPGGTLSEWMVTKLTYG